MCKYHKNVAKASALICYGMRCFKCKPNKRMSRYTSKTSETPRNEEMHGYSSHKLFQVLPEYLNTIITFKHNSRVYVNTLIVEQAE